MRWEDLVECILALRPGWTAAELGAFRYLEGGYSNANYRFRYQDAEFVLRIPGKANAYTDRDRERRFYESVRALPAPEVIAFDPATGVMISRWISGRLLADLDPAPARLSSYLRDLHARLRAVERQVPGVFDRRYDPLAQARASLAAANAAEWIMAIAEAVDWRPPELTVCHNDLNPWNLIETADGGWITLDWEWVGRNDPLFDLVALHQGLGKPDALLPQLALELLGVPADPGRLDACLTVFWLREFGWASAEIAGGSTRAEILAQQALGERKLRALDRPPRAPHGQ